MRLSICSKSSDCKDTWCVHRNWHRKDHACAVKCKRTLGVDGAKCSEEKITKEEYALLRLSGELAED